MCNSATIVVYLFWSAISVTHRSARTDWPVPHRAAVSPSCLPSTRVPIRLHPPCVTLLHRTSSRPTSRPRIRSPRCHSRRARMRTLTCRNPTTPSAHSISNRPRGTPNGHARRRAHCCRSPKGRWVSTRGGSTLGSRGYFTVWGRARLHWGRVLSGCTRDITAWKTYRCVPWFVWLAYCCEQDGNMREEGYMKLIKPLYMPI